jgi:hypothetical protein
MPTPQETAIREAALKTADATVPTDIAEPLRSDLVTTFASLLAIGVAQERQVQRWQRVEAHRPDLQVLPGGDGPPEPEAA